MRMIIANCTQQVLDFQYRLLENPKVLQQRIEIGGQIQIPGDLSTPDIEYIESQHRRYGLVRVDEIDRTKPFIGTCFAIDKRIDVDKIKRALAHNLDVLDKRGQEIRRDAAVAVNNAVEEQVRPIQNLDIREMEFSIEEERSKGKDIEVNENILVSKAEGTPSRPTRSRARTRRAA